MHNFTQLTQLELVLLELVDKGQGKWGWYELANALSRRDVPREPDMMIVLKKLANKGLLQRYIEPGSPRDRWELTPEGKRLLTRQNSRKGRLFRHRGEKCSSRYKIFSGGLLRGSKLIFFSKESYPNQAQTQVKHPHQTN